MSDLGEYFQKVSDKLSILSSDIERIKFNEVSPPEKKKDMKSLQPVTRLRANKKEAQDAFDNPEITFINDILNDAFKD